MAPAVAAPIAAAPTAAAPAQTWSERFNSFVEVLPSFMSGFQVKAEDGFFATVAKVTAVALSSIITVPLALAQIAWNRVASFCPSSTANQAVVAAPVVAAPVVAAPVVAAANQQPAE